MAKNTSLKRPGELHEYSNDMVHDLLRCSRDPIYFIENYCKIVHPVKGLVNFELYDYQKEMVRLFSENRFSILCASRQSGKSQTSCAFLLWYAIFNELKTILIVSNKSSGAKEMISRIVFMYEHLPNWLKTGINPNNWNKMTIEFDNKSKIVAEATTANSGRGLSISLCFCDEFAFVGSSNSGSNNEEVADAFWTSLSPTLATGGSCIIASTPNGDDNLYASLWRGAETNSNGFKSLLIPWNIVPGRDEDFKTKEIGKIGKDKWEQEYECRFLSSDPLLFKSAFLLEYNPGPQPEPDSRGILWFEPIVPKKTYILAIDPSTGTGSDYSVIIIYSFPELTQVAEFRSNTTSTPAVYNTLKYIFKLLKHKGVEICYWSLENNGIGEGMISMYESDPEPIEFGDLVSDDGKKRLGFTTGKNKNKNCLGLKQLFEHGKLVVRSKITLSEMKNFVKSKGSYAARAGSTDDTISAHLILIQILNNIIAYEDDAYAVMYEDFEGDEMNEFDDDNGFVPLPIVSGNSPGAYTGPYNQHNFMDYFWDNWSVPH